ncbi:MAG: two-component sensor histidine kinase [Deltaproteobacteria bacterium]|nr:MAG: two-component sensor histidine kinase [Deltaproteobacteria bacterium]
MTDSSLLPEGDQYLRLEWLMFARLLFTTLLLGSTIVLQLNQTQSLLSVPLLFLYGLIVFIFLLSFFYTILLNRVKSRLHFAYGQIGIDTFIVTMIIYVTGSFSSIFSFLYLVVIIYSSMLLYRKGSMFMVGLCALQYSLLVGLEYYGIIKPYVIDESLLAAGHAWSHVFYKIMIIVLGCFAVAILSSLLAEQTIKTKKELWAMEDHIKRVEKMAAIGEMGAGLAHEIKNPLASLTGSIQLLRDGLSRNSDHDRLMQIVLREADRLSSLVNNFLLFARPPAGKLEPIDLEKALTEAVELFEKDNSCLSRIKINKEIASGIWIEMDWQHLRQVLWNLFLNSSEAIDGQGSIDIKLYPLKGKQACIEITDDGCGMSNETMDSIFDPFFTTKKSGTGLGLSIVHSILDSYHSRLEVKSKINTGTTFTLRFTRIDPPT